ncbi:MAG: Peptidase M4 [Sporanaerobacter sp.]|uniref:YcdB/YcdC domain-containing protein n=1 Tax=Sporanaerobacter sp. TaxID=2010183 RepID=UPI003A10258D
MKKRVSAVLAIVMILTLIPIGSFAQQNFDKQLKEAITKSKELFNIGKEYDKFSSDVSSYDGKTAFHLNWSDSKEKLGSINVSVTVDGEILSYSKYKPYYGENRPKLPKVSKDQGLKIAKDFIGKVSPDIAKNMEYVDRDEQLDIYSDSYNYFFTRTVNGIPYSENNINITVDNITGEVRDYYTNWDKDIVFSEAKDVISNEKAQELYKEKIGLKLIYKTSYMETEPRLYLTYASLRNDVGIDAKNGEVVQIDYYGPYYEGMDMHMGAKGEENAEDLSPDEQKAVESVSGLISEEEAEKLGRKYLEIDKDYKLESANLYKNWKNKGEYKWYLGFVKNVNGVEKYSNVAINAKSKELISFYRWADVNSNKEIKYSEKQALDIAKNFIAKTNPEKVNNIEFIESISDSSRVEGDPQKIVYLNFMRIEDGAYVLDDAIRVSVDLTEGKIIEYEIDWYNGKLPSKDKVISIDEAYDILFDKIGMEVRYTVPSRYDKIDNKKLEAILVYALKKDRPNDIDANTGEILDYQGMPYVKREKISYKDIDKSYAKDKINILTQYGIGFPGDEFKPSEKLTQRDFLFLLAKANNSYLGSDILNNDEKLYSYLMNTGIVKDDEKAPKKIITKEEAIKYIIRALKYDKVADLNSIYKDLFKDTKDINPELKGYVSIAYGLKIVEGNNGYLRPKAELKREDGANLIYNFLFSN